MSNLNLIDLNKTIENYKKIESNFQKKPTFFEIAGFPSRENVYSNVLKYFLDSRQHHGFSTLILQALLRAAGVTDEYDLQTLEIQRETLTDNGGFIDITIRTKDLIIAIENKVFHHANSNDFDDYSFSLKRKWPGKMQENYIQIILALTPDNISVENWKVASYREFIKYLSDVLTHIDSANIYQLYFADFIKNIQNHLNPVIMTKEQINFLIENEITVEEIYNLKAASNRYLYNRSRVFFNTFSLPENWKKSIYDNQIVAERNNGDDFIKVYCDYEISSICFQVDASLTIKEELISSFSKKGYSQSETPAGILVKEYSPISDVTDNVIVKDFESLLYLAQSVIDLKFN